MSSRAVGDLLALAGSPARLPARAQPVAEGERRERLYLLVSGWGYAYRTFPDGRHHVVEVYVPGELVGLTEGWLGASGPGIVMLTPAVVAPIGRTILQDRAHASPELAQGLATLMAHANDGLSHRLSSVARHTAYERLAALLWSLRARLPDGLDGADGFECPLPQHVIGDALGLSAVHVNRSLRQLTRDGVLRKQASRVEIHDANAFARIARG